MRPSAPLLVAALFLAGAAAEEKPAAPALPTTQVVINNSITAHVEVATTPEARMRGLMGTERANMARNAGMLFVFESPSRQCFWMRDTWLPLRVTFLDANGAVIHNAIMQPLDETSRHCADNALRALETRPDLVDDIFSVSVVAPLPQP